jgi:hypothetical protein
MGIIRVTTRHIQNFFLGDEPLCTPLIEGFIYHTTNGSITLVDQTPYLSFDDISIRPNPFSDYINLSYSMEKPSNIIISISDFMGNEILSINKGFLESGSQHETIPTSSFPSGIYFIRVSTSYMNFTRKAVLVR